MKFKSSKKNVILLTLCMVVFTVGLSLSLKINKTDTGIAIDTHSAIPFAHGAPGDGCTKCHTGPIVASCSSCHPNPDDMIGTGNDIDFDHHDGTTVISCGSSSCHDADETVDIRIIAQPNAAHGYCTSCHSMGHS